MLIAQASDDVAGRHTKLLLLGVPEPPAAE